MEDEYLDDSEELDEGGYIQYDDDESDEDFEEDEEQSEEDKQNYDGKLTETEYKLSLDYDDITELGKKAKDDDNSIQDIITILVAANPKHTNQKTINDLVRSILGRSGHNRMVNTIYTPDSYMTAEEAAEVFGDSSNTRFNNEFMNEARELVRRFIEYLASRDLSKDSAFSKRRKQRHIPAFIIFLFSSGLYDLILNCDTLPPEYAKQIENALKVIMKRKYDIVEELAREYEKAGRQEVADRVRKLQLSWFEREPAELRTLSEFSDLGLTYDDVVIYRNYRSKFNSISRAITQDAISDLIRVIIDPESGIYEELKDKTRSEAISDVKQVWKSWVKENAEDSELAKRIIWKEI